MKKVEFLLPSVPAPIGGFKVVYHQARILKRAGYAVNVQHVNVVKKDRRFIKKYISILNFLRRKYFDIWKYYPKYYDLDYSVSNEINQKEDINLWVVASWQLLEQVMNNKFFIKKNIAHISMDYPNYMGPKEKVLKSWNYNIAYLPISKNLKESILNENPLAKTFYIPALVGDYIKKLKNKKKRKIFCVISSGKYKNQYNLIQLLNKLSKFIYIETFSRELRPKILHSSIKHFRNLSNEKILSSYAESMYSISYSEFEGFSIPGFDAMMNGCILFTTNNFGNIDYINPGKDCILLDGKNIDTDINIIKLNFEISETERFNIAKNAIKTCNNFLTKYDNTFVLDTYNKLMH